MKHCDRCDLPDCQWVAGPHCEGQARIRAMKEFAPAQTRQQWPWGLRWLARKISAQMVELEALNDYWCSIIKRDFENIRLVDLKVKPDEFQMLLRTGVGGLIVTWMLQAIRSIGASAYVELRGCHPKEGDLVFTVLQMSGEAPGARAERYERIIRSYVTPRPIAEYRDDMGDMLFWTLDEKGQPVQGPYAGTPNDVKQLHLVDGKVSIDGHGVIRDQEGRSMHMVECCLFPATANYFTHLPEASLNWKPPAAPPVNTVKI